MPTLKTTFPSRSVLYKAATPYHYADSYATMVKDLNNSLCAADAAKAFFTAAPPWVDKLFSIRNRMVSLIGLKTAGKAINRQAMLDNFTCRPGEQMGLFRVFASNELEVVLGENDRHLDFRISLLLNNAGTLQKELFISTTVVFHNWLGRAYFLPVKPFHKLIVPVMLREIARQLEQEANRRSCA